MVNLTQYCQEHLGYDIKSNRAEIGDRCGAAMLEHLYNAVVGWSPDQGKLSSALTPAQALSMRDAFNSYTAKSDKDKSNAESMAEACERYGQCNDNRTVIKKGKNPCMRHSLQSLNGAWVEKLTWVEPAEVARINQRFGAIGGYPDMLQKASYFVSLNSVKKDNLRKTAIGEGAFGIVRLARLVNSDEYVAMKKSHSKRLHCGCCWTYPPSTRLVEGLNDGAQDRLIKVYHTGKLPNPTSDARKVGFNLFDVSAALDDRGGYPEDSVFSILELGVQDMGRVIQSLNLMSVIFCGEINVKYPANLDLYIEQLGVINQKYEQRFPGNMPDCDLFQYPELEQFQNRMALEMLLAVDQMHQKGYVHRDIKPDNFTLVIDQKTGKLSIKIMDFDFLRTEKYADHRRKGIFHSFASPQQRRGGINSKAKLNDAYSLGATLGRLAGDSALTTYEIAQAARKGESKVMSKEAYDAMKRSNPGLLALTHVAQRMMHHESGKRLSVQQALQEPLFADTSRVMSEEKFQEKLLSLAKISSVLSPDILERFDVDKDNRAKHCRESDKVLFSRAKECERVRSETAQEATYRRVGGRSRHWLNMRGSGVRESVSKVGAAASSSALYLFSSKYRNMSAREKDIHYRAKWADDSAVLGANA